MRVFLKGVSPPDPAWAPDYPSAEAYRQGVDMLKAAGVEVRRTEGTFWLTQGH